MRPKDIRSYNWLAIAMGAKGIVYWQYLPEGTGQESTRNGLVSRDGSTTERAEEAARNHELIQAQWAAVLCDYRPKPRVAILYDPDNALLTFALTGKETSSIDSIRGYYKGFWQMDHVVDFIEPGDLAAGDYKVVVAPWHLIGKEATCAALHRYVEGGGTLILEAAFGLYDERFFYNPVIPPHGLADVFGYREEHNLLVRDVKLPADMSQDDAIYYQPEIKFSEPSEIQMTAHTLLTPIEITSSKQIATSNGMPIGVRKRVGNGEVFYIGTSLGAALLACDEGAMELLRGVVGRAATPEVTSANLRPRLLRGESHSLLVIFNDTPQDQTARIQLPVEFRSAKDIHSGKASLVTDHNLEVEVPNEDVVVLQLGN